MPGLCGMLIRVCLICWYMQASAGQHLPVLICIYVYLLVFALSLLSCGTKRSEAERGRSSIIVFQLWEQVWQSRVRLLLITCWKVWGSLWIVSCVLPQQSRIKRASRSHAKTGLFWSFLDTFSGYVFRWFSGAHFFAFSMVVVCPWVQNRCFFDSCWGLFYD